MSRYTGSVTVELDPLVALDARVLDTEALEHGFAGCWLAASCWT
jgi:hypothetical protein